MTTQDGSDEVARMAADLTAAGPRAVLVAGQVLAKSLADIQAGAAARAPVDTGNLRNSISRQVGGSGGTLRGEVGPTAKYGGYVENGTSRMRAQPYLRPATDAVLPGYEQALAQLAQEAIE